jgi:hypothetical protein
MSQKAERMSVKPPRKRGKRNLQQPAIDHCSDDVFPHLFSPGIQYLLLNNGGVLPPLFFCLGREKIYCPSNRAVTMEFYHFS